jgi:hypothetical protein
VANLPNSSGPLKPSASPMWTVFTSPPPNTELVLPGEHVLEEFAFVRLAGFTNRAGARAAGDRVARSATPNR